MAEKNDDAHRRFEIFYFLKTGQNRMLHVQRTVVTSAFSSFIIIGPHTTRGYGVHGLCHMQYIHVYRFGQPFTFKVLQRSSASPHRRSVA